MCIRDRFLHINRVNVWDVTNECKNGFASCNRNGELKVIKVVVPYCQHQVYSDFEFESGLIQNTCRWLGRTKHGLRWFLRAIVEIRG